MVVPVRSACPGSATSSGGTWGDEVWPCGRAAGLGQSAAQAEPVFGRRFPAHHGTGSRRQTAIEHRRGRAVPGLREASRQGEGKTIDAWKPPKREVAVETGSQRRILYFRWRGYGAVHEEEPDTGSGSSAPLRPKPADVLTLDSTRPTLPGMTWRRRTI